MYSAQTQAPPRGPAAMFGRVTGWMDERGKPAWIAATVLGFVFFWPAGLAILGYTIWSKRMFNRSSGGCAARRHAQHWGHHHQRGGWNTSGNSAFDAYKSDTLRRLEEEQQAFETFLQRLREAKDKSEFDAFMDDRAKANRAADVTPADDAGRPGAY